LIYWYFWSIFLHRGQATCSPLKYYKPKRMCTPCLKPWPKKLPTWWIDSIMNLGEHIIGCPKISSQMVVSILSLTKCLTPRWCKN
jgi:hypothetical protein